jgi:hypothetical protein
MALSNKNSLLKYHNSGRYPCPIVYLKHDVWEEIQPPKRLVLNKRENDM